MGERPARPLVLVVDDDEDHLLMLEAMLDSVGYDVLTAGSCSEAHAQLREHEIDALVADLALGDGTALDLMKRSPRRPRVAVVLSGFDSDEDVRRTLQAGYDAHLPKPTQPDVLRDVLAEGLRRNKGASPTKRPRR